MIEGKKYQGEITLVKIQDGIDGAGLKEVYDFYLLSNSGDAPAVPSTSLSVEEIENTQPKRWTRTIPSGLGEDYPYIWHFRRTEFGVDRVEHSAPIIASFWATAPSVKARYSANQFAPWEETYKETEHNFIIFSYDGGKTWTPATSADNTDLNTLQGGIRIKGRVEVDQEALDYGIISSQNELVFYNQENSNQIMVSPRTLIFQVEKRYLGITEILNLDGVGVKEKQSYSPKLNLELVAYSNSSSTINLNSIIKSVFGSEDEIIEYDYVTDTIIFNFGTFYDEIVDRFYKGEATLEMSEVANIFLGTESFLRVKITLTNEKDSFTKEAKYPVRFASSYDLANLSVHAHGITQSIRNTKLIFDADGLTVNNGGIKINSYRYKKIDVTASSDFLKNDYYIFTEEGYKKQSSFIEGIQFYTAEPIEVFGVDNFGNLQVIGNGQFSGTIYAKDGIFSGQLKASSGYLENLDISGELTIQGLEEGEPGIKIRGLYNRLTGEYDENKTYYYYDDDLKIFRTYVNAPGQEQATVLFEKNQQPGIFSTNFSLGYKDVPDRGFYLDPTQGKIWASSMVLGNDVSIHDRIIFGSEDSTRGEICNPAKYSNTFVQAYDNNGTSVLRMTTKGQLYVGPYTDKEVGSIWIDGSSGQIRSGNFVSGSRGWRINNLNAEFNNIIARGTLKTAVFEYDKISAIGGTVLIRPCALITDAIFIEDSAGNKDKTKVILSLETQQITFRSPDNKEPYYFCIGESSINLGNSLTTNTGLNIRGKECYALVTESTDAKQKTVTIQRASKREFTEEEISNFIGDVLIGYGKAGDIGIGLNSQNSSTALPPEAITIFQTDFIYNEDTKEQELYENARIIIGKIREEDEQVYGLSGYGLYADNVNVKGELTSRTLNYYSGINSNSTTFEAGKSDEGSQIVIWAGADIKNAHDPEGTAKAIQNAPFRVNLDGTVHANKGVFRGDIYGSTITSSKLRAAVIEGYNRDDDKVAALSITNAKEGIKFSDFIIDNGHEIESVYLRVTNTQMDVGVKLEANQGILTPTLSITDNLAINNGLVRLGAFQGASDLSILYKDEWTEEYNTQQIAFFSKEGFYCKKNTYLDGSIYFGNQTMEYKKVYQDETKILIGYDLFIKS